ADHSNSSESPTKKHGVVDPLPGQANSEGSNPAADLIRKKLDELYKNEPSAEAEIAESESVRHRSKHQEFMHKLSHSGKSLAEIQTQWHNYYTNLPDEEKHEVWREFYSVQEQQQTTTQSTVTPEPHESNPTEPKTKSADNRTVGEVKEQLLGKVTARGK